MRLDKAHQRRRRHTPCRAWLLLSTLGLWCGGYIGGGSRGSADAFGIPGRLQQQRLLGKRSCLSRGGVPQCAKRRSSTSRAHGLVMDTEGAGAPAVPIPKTYSRNGKWTVYSSNSSRFPPQKRDPNRALSTGAQARREKEYELGTKIQRMVKLQKLKAVLTPADGEANVSYEAWALAAGETVEDLKRALEEGETAKEELVLSNLSLVDIIVKNYVSTFSFGRFTEKDLIQDGTVGLIRAVEKFDPDRGFLFSTYGRWWVRKFLHEGVQNHDRMVRIPNSAAYRIAKVKRVRAELERELGRAPTKPELALEAGYTVQQVEACLEQDGFYIERLDKYMGHGFGIADNLFAAHFGDSFLYGTDMLGPHPGESLEPTPEGTRVVQVSMREDISNAFVRLLDATERECLVLRYGLHDGVTNSIEETAEIMDFCDPDDVRIITTQAMAKLRTGCLPEERKKLMSYLSVYEPKSPNYSKSNYDPSKNKGNRRNRTSSSSSSGGRFDVENGYQARVDDGEARSEEQRRAGVRDLSRIGEPGWMKAKPEGESASATVNERRLWESQFSNSEEREKIDARMEFNPVVDERKGLKVNGDGSSSGSSSSGVRGEERELWDFSKHGQEELQDELTRYLRRHRLSKKNAEKAAALAKENAAALAAEEAAAGTGSTISESSSTRRKKTTTTAAASATTAAAATHDGRIWEKSAAVGRGKVVAASATKATSRRRVSSKMRLGRYSRSAVDLAQQQREERRLELEQRARAEEEEWERKKALRPIPVGSGAGSAVVGDLEPVPNSREADQLEHLSRLLWDGEEEPKDFALTYGKNSKRRSLQ